MVDVVLARPGLSHAAESRWSEIPPLGLAYLASHLRSHGFSVAVVDGKMEKHRQTEMTASRIAAYKPRFLGISAMTVDFPEACHLAGVVKRLIPVTIILGGCHANTLPARSLEEGKGFDYVLAGEGEESLVNLCTAIDNNTGISHIAGLHLRTFGGEVICTVPPNFTTDLETLCFPAWDLFPLSESYPIMTERGCPFNCVFCSRNLKKRVRTRSINSVVEEVKWVLGKFHPQVIMFQDETFGFDAEKTIELLKRLVTIHRAYGVRFAAQTRVDRMTGELATYLKRAGFCWLELGVESGNPNVLAQSGKGITIDQVRKAVGVAKRQGLRIWLKFILGLPGETRQTIIDTIRFACHLRPQRISVSLIVAYPGSQIYRWAENGEMGYRLLTTDWSKFDKYLSPSIELENISYAELKSWQVLMYLLVYLRGFRILELGRFFWLGKSLILSVLSPSGRNNTSRQQLGESNAQQKE